MSAHRESVDVLIIGAGPAGCAAGITLARAGLDVRVVDRATFPRPKVCGDALSNKAIAIISTLGAGDALRAAPHTDVLGALALLPDGSSIPRDYGEARGMIVTRLALDDLLARALVAAGAKLTEGVRVEDLVVERGVVVGARLAGDGGQTIRARAVIAADGPGSVAARALGTKKPAGRGLAISATAYFEGVTGALRVGWSEHWFDPALPYGYGWIFPAIDGVANVGVYLRRDGYDARGVPLQRLFDGFLSQHADRFASARRIGDVRTWQLPLSDLGARVGMPGLLTVGDAGRHVDPLTGEGIWQALRTGELAGEVCGAALRRGALDGAAVRRYRLRVAREVDAPATLRGRIQDAMQALVASGLYRRRELQALLAWGYGSGALEVSKSVSGGAR